ncbi:MAG: egtD, partial [Conexibacter sp.]|nr:egtD [Conexibacter sp.]
MEPTTATTCTATTTGRDRVVVESFIGGGDLRSLADVVLVGLTRRVKELPPTHFYDAHGAQLFDQICVLP